MEWNLSKSNEWTFGFWFLFVVIVGPVMKRFRPWMDHCASNWGFGIGGSESSGVGRRSSNDHGDIVWLLSCFFWRRMWRIGRRLIKNGCTSNRHETGRNPISKLMQELLLCFEMEI
jgi:hypothetical protein